MLRRPSARSLLLLVAGLGGACAVNTPEGSDGGGAYVDGGVNGGGGTSSKDPSLPAADGGGLAVAITASMTTLCPGQCVDLTASASGGVPPYSFHWDHGLGDGAHAERTCPEQTTRYEVTVDDAVVDDDEFSRDHPAVSEGLEIVVADESACRDGELIDAGGVPIDSLDACTFRAHLVGGGLVADAAQKNHQSLIDAHGNLVLIGTFSGVLDVDGTKLDAGGDLGGYVIKMDPSCHVLWAKVFASEPSGGNALWLAAVARDLDGNLYLGGGFNGKSVLGDSAASMASGFAGFLLKLDANGDSVWTKVYRSNYLAVAVTDLVTDAQGRLTFIGYAGFDTSFGGGPLALIGGSSQPFLAQLATDGTFAWSRSFVDADLMYGLANGPYDDSVVITGWATGTINLGSGPLSLGKGSRFLAKINSLGQTRFTHALPHGADIDQWNWWKGGVVVDTWGNVVVLRDEPETLPGDAGDRILDDSVEQYDLEGASTWQTRLSPATTWENAWGDALAIFSDDHPLRFGSFYGDTAYAGQALASRGRSDVALVELDEHGTPLWAYQLGDTFDDRVLAVAVDYDDHIFASYGSITDESNGNQDLVVVRLQRP